MTFSSDNAAGCCPEISAALVKAAEGSAPSYGADEWSKRVEARFNDLFEREVKAFPVVTGTSANALALASLVPPYGAIYCHHESHINVDECGAPEFFTNGAKLVDFAGPLAKIDPGALESAIGTTPKGFVHSVQPGAVSITQSTELGTVYSIAEVAALAEVCRRHSLPLHMDGARFANAVASLGCSPADITWRAGVDVLSFGATKNGAWAAEAVIFFDPTKAADFEFRRKRAGHLISKMRFVSAQLDAYLDQDLWLRNARHANRMAQILAEGIGADVLAPVQANEVFARIAPKAQESLRQDGFAFYAWPWPGEDAARLVTSFSTSEDDVRRFVESITKLRAATA